MDLAAMPLTWLPPQKYPPLQNYGRPAGRNGTETTRGHPITGPAIRDVFCAKKKKARGGGAWLSGAIIKRG